MERVSVHLCGDRHLPLLWDKILAPMLERAMAYHPFMDTTDLLCVIRDNKADLAVVIDGERVCGAIVLEVVQFPRVRVCNVIAVAGEYGSLKKYAKETDTFITSWSRERGCHKIGTLARRGWARYFAATGWQTRPYLTAWKNA